MPTVTPTQAVSADTWTPVANSLVGSLIPRVTATGTGQVGVRIKDANGKVLHQSVGPSPQQAGWASGASSTEVWAATAQTLSLTIVT